MGNILLFYDTNDADLVRDFEDLLKEWNIGDIIRIPAGANRSLSLEGKEKHYLDSAEAVIFFVTAGSQRIGSGQINPSASVSHEMGQVKTRLDNKKLNSVFCLVEEGCTPAAIDQMAYIPFKRNDMRSVIQALHFLIKDLKQAGLYRTTPIPEQTALPAKKFNLEVFITNLPHPVREVLFDISNKPNGSIDQEELEKLLATKYSMTIQDINLFKRELQSLDLVVNMTGTVQNWYSFWYLSNMGWEVVKFDVAKKKKEGHDTLRNLLGVTGIMSPFNPIVRPT